MGNALWRSPLEFFRSPSTFCNAGVSHHNLFVSPLDWRSMIALILSVQKWFAKMLSESTRPTTRFFWMWEISWPRQMTDDSRHGSENTHKSFSNNEFYCSRQEANNDRYFLECFQRSPIDRVRSSSILATTSLEKLLTKLFHNDRLTTVVIGALFWRCDGKMNTAHYN